MEERETYKDSEEIFSKALRAGRRTYFFDVRSTKADDYYLTITESKKFTNDDGSFRYRKHKIYLYKEDFEGFKQSLEECTDYILEERGNEVISDKHQSDFSPEYDSKDKDNEAGEDDSQFTDVKFEDL